MTGTDKGIKLFSGLPDWSKGVLAIIGVGTLITVGYIVYKKVIDKTDEDKKDKELKGSVSDEISKFIKAGQKQSFNDSQYLQDAETIHSAIRVCAGDDYDTAEKTLKKMKNDLDVALLIRAFGKRQDYCFGIPTAEMNLFPYIRKELGAEWAGLTSYRVNRINSDWKKKGITYQI